VRRVVLRVFEHNRSELEATVSWVSFADEHGTISIEWSTEKNIATAIRSLSLGAGADLSMDDAGLNGIGDAIATRSLSVVRGTEHDDEKFHELVCAAAPVLHPLTGEICGIVTVTGHLRSPNSHVAIALKLITAQIRAELGKGLAPKSLLLADAHRRVKAHFPNAVATFDANTLISESGLAPQLVSIDRQELWESTSRLSASATEVKLPSGPRVRVVPVTKGTWEDGASAIFDVLRPDAVGDQTLVDPDGQRLTPLEIAERNVIATVLSQCEGNKSDAADRLGLSRGTLYARIRRYGL
jgi:transcriptional regulator of acetoin/glycerol metabolism